MPLPPGTWRARKITGFFLTGRQDSGDFFASMRNDEDSGACYTDISHLKRGINCVLSVSKRRTGVHGELKSPCLSSPGWRLVFVHGKPPV